MTFLADDTLLGSFFFGDEVRSQLINCFLNFRSKYLTKLTSAATICDRKPQKLTHRVCSKSVTFAFLVCLWASFSIHVTRWLQTLAWPSSSITVFSLPLRDDRVWEWFEVFMRPSQSTGSSLSDLTPLRGRTYRSSSLRSLAPDSASFASRSYRRRAVTSTFALLALWENFHQYKSASHFQKLWTPTLLNFNPLQCSCYFMYHRVCLP